MENLFFIFLLFVVVVVTVYKFTKIGLIDDAIKCFKRDILRRK